MSQYQSVNAITVKCWGEIVGYLAQKPNRNFYGFEYEPKWQKRGIELSPLHMPVKENYYEFPNLDKGTFLGLPPMIADALPDAFGNAVIDAWLAEKGINKSEISALDRLAYTGSRAMGALEFEPAEELPTEKLNSIQLADLVQEARFAINSKSRNLAGNMQLRNLIQVGSSAGGARAKALIQFNPKTEQFRDGNINEEVGFDKWLIKFDGISNSADGSVRSNDSPEMYTRIEYAYYLMAIKCGIIMSESRLHLDGSRAHFMTKRFDRDNGDIKIHHQSLCAIDLLDFRITGTHSYDQYFNVIDELALDETAKEQAFLRMVFNVIAMNRDDHTKNFAFLMRSSGNWELAPAFDITHSYRVESQWVAKHQMSINGKFDKLELEDLYAVGEKHRISGYKKKIKKVAEVVMNLDSFFREAQVLDSTTQKIISDIKNLTPIDQILK